MKRLRIFLISLLALIVILFVARKPIKQYLQHRIQEKLLEFINTSPDRLYDYAVDHIDISVIGGNTILKGVRIMPRAGAFDSLQQTRTGYLIEAVVDSVALNGLGLYNLFVEGSIHIQRILVGEVDFKYAMNSAYERPDSIVRKPFVLKDMFSAKLKKAYVRRVELRNIDFISDDIQTKEAFLTRFDSAQMVLKEIYTDEEVMKGAQPFTYESFELSARRFISTKIKGHTVRVESFRLNTSDKEIILKGAAFGPTDFDYNNPEKQFIRSINDIAADEVRLSGINFDSWQNVGWVEIRKVQVANPRIRISMDHRWPKPMFEREFLQARLSHIPFPILIDTISATGGQIYYREIFTDGKPPLILTFSDAMAQFLNVTNLPSRIEKDPNIKFTASAKFLDVGNLTVKTDFRMNDTMNPFHLTLSLYAMPLATLNPILEGQAHARLDGQLNTLAMNVQANRKGAHGDFIFDYTGLKVEIFKVKETKKGVKIKKNWLVNSLVNPILRTNNHVDQANFKGGNISYVRPPDVSFFGMTWQCLKDGMMSTLIPGNHDKPKKESKGKSKKKGK
jgi:hypothetical protein